MYVYIEMNFTGSLNNYSRGTYEYLQNIDTTL